MRSETVDLVVVATTTGWVTAMCVPRGFLPWLPAFCRCWLLYITVVGVTGWVAGREWWEGVRKAVGVVWWVVGSGWRVAYDGRLVVGGVGGCVDVRVCGRVCGCVRCVDDWRGD